MNKKRSAFDEAVLDEEDSLDNLSTGRFGEKRKILLWFVYPPNSNRKSVRLCRIAFELISILPPPKDGVPSAATKTVAERVNQDEFGAKDYRNELDVKKDFNSRPIWVVSIR